MNIHNKNGLEFSFTWLFAVIIGAVILVLAIYAATKLMSTGGLETSTATAKEIGILLNPLETSFEEGKTTSISVNTETRIYNGCDDDSGNFGKQLISVSQKSFGKFTEPSIEVSFPNKYIFSEDYEEGKKFYIFSKPFEFPFKIADLIYISSADKKYCFIDAPKNIEEELNQIKQENFATGNCSTLNGFIRVCFGTLKNCEIRVNYNLKYVEKNKSSAYFETDALMYGAIFSEKNIYECQVKRLMQRAGELSSIYSKKSNLLSQKECNSNLELDSFKILLSDYESSSDLSLLSNKADEIKGGNDAVSCGMW